MNNAIPIMLIIIAIIGLSRGKESVEANIIGVFAVIVLVVLLVSFFL